MLSFYSFLRSTYLTPAVKMLSYMYFYRLRTVKYLPPCINNKLSMQDFFSSSCV